MDRLKLFDSDGDSSDEDKIEINQEFAKRYEHNKKREELHRYEALKKQGLVDSSDSDSEESSSGEEELIKPSKKTDAAFFDALIKVKNQDPILREQDAKLFDSDVEEDGDNNADRDTASKKKVKPMYLKDVVSKQLIEAGPELSDEEEESEDDDGAKNKLKSYSEEQEELRRQIVKSLEEGKNDDDDDGDFLRVKSSAKDEEDEEEDDVIAEKLDEYFGEDEKLDNDTMFLKDYFRKRMWLDDEKSKGRGDVEVDVSEDEDELEKQEDYEREYNFRFEENAGDRVMGHSRKVEGSVRKKDNARKMQRERKEERMAQAEFERKEELKRLKNVKKKEMNEKLKKIREVAGIGEAEGIFLDKDDLEEEFDPEAHDRRMKEAFGEEYYGAEDVDPQFGSDDDEDEEGFEKPDFDKEDELLGLDKGWDEVDKSAEGFKSVRERIMKDRLANGKEDAVDEVGGDERKEGGSKRKRKHKPSEVEKAVMEELLEEYYKLDYEDTIGDLKTRFKYKPVKAKRFGLTTEEILDLDDKELNQYVSLKKIAPYREKEWEVPRIKTIQLKESKYRKGNTSRAVDEDRKGHRKGKVKEEGKVKDEDKGKEVELNAVGSEKLQPMESNGDQKTVSRKRKRKLKQAELKIPEPRLMAYGKIPSKSKSKK